MRVTKPREGDLRLFGDQEYDVYQCQHCCGRYWVGERLGDRKSHQCPPQWYVWEEGEDPQECAVVAHGQDAQEALEKWAQAYDADGDYQLAQGDRVRVRIKPVGTEGSGELFEVEGETVPQGPRALP